MNRSGMIKVLHYERFHQTHKARGLEVPRGFGQFHPYRWSIVPRRPVLQTLALLTSFYGNCGARGAFDLHCTMINNESCLEDEIFVLGFIRTLTLETMYRSARIRDGETGYEEYDRIDLCVPCPPRVIILFYTVKRYYYSGGCCHYCKPMHL